MKIDVIASGSGGNAYLIADGATTLLLDAGVSYREIQVASNFRLSSINGCLVTHSHMDHCKACKDLLKHGTDVYMSYGTMKELGLKGHRLKPVNALEEIRIGSFQVLPFDVEHDAPDPLGFLLTSQVTREKLLYFTDTYFLKYTFTGLTHIMAECNYSREIIKKNIEDGLLQEEMYPRLIKSHMSLENFLNLLKFNDLSQLKQIYLIHLSKNNSNKEMFKKAIQKVTGVEVYIC